jgi:hypothetical protein
MNLRNIANGATCAVNPNVLATIQQSAGYETRDDGTQAPKYNTITGVKAQVQEMTSGDIKRMESLNIQNVQQKVYLNGNFEGVFRVLGKGGDLLIIGGRVYLITIVFERWPDWCSVGVTMQLNTDANTLTDITAMILDTVEGSASGS